MSKGQVKWTKQTVSTLCVDTVPLIDSWMTASTLSEQNNARGLTVTMQLAGGGGSGAKRSRLTVAKLIHNHLKGVSLLQLMPMAYSSIHLKYSD